MRLRQRFFLVAIGTSILLLLINVAYLSSLTPERDEQKNAEVRFGAAPQKEIPPPPSPPMPTAEALQSRSRSRCTNSSTAIHVTPYNPVAKPEAIIQIGGRMRLTILTAVTLRIEQLDKKSEDNTFDERASFAIVNRNLPQVPPYRVTLGRCELLPSSLSSANNWCLIVTTARLRLEQRAPESATRQQLVRLPDGSLHAEWPAPPLSKDALRVRLQLHADDGATEEWWPQKPNPRQLPGTLRTLDKADGATELTCSRLPSEKQRGQSEDAHCVMAVISRDGWALLDDTSTGRFDGKGASRPEGWDWAAPLNPSRLAKEAMERAADSDPRCEQWARSGECARNAAFMRSACLPACERAAARSAEAAVATEELRADWYLFAPGLEYHLALSDLSALSGAPPIPPRYAFGVWFSRWWPWSDWEALSLIDEFEERSTPVDVLITDMDWCAMRARDTLALSPLLNTHILHTPPHHHCAPHLQAPHVLSSDLWRRLREVDGRLTQLAVLVGLQL